MSRSSSPTLLLVDGHALAYRAYHALPPTLSARDGEPTNATFGFTSMLIDVLRAHAPTHAAVAFDAGRTGRDQIHPAYKANRVAMDDAMRLQMARINEVVEAFGIPIYRIEGWEADDVIATLAGQAAARGVDTLIVSGDSDLYQLIDAHTRVVTSGRRFGDPVVYDAARVVERYGVQPAQLVDWKGIKGDPSDNIPGVPGVGEKSATQLLQRWGSLEDALLNLDAVEPARLREALRAHAEVARLGVRLVAIRHDAPVALDLDACAWDAFDRERVMALFRQLDFRALAERLPEPTTAAGSTAESDGSAERHGPDGQYAVVDTLEGLAALVTRLRTAARLAFDTETTNKDPMRASLVGIALSDGPDHGWYVPVAHRAAVPDDLPVQTVLPGTEDHAAAVAARPVEAPRNLPLVDVLAALAPVLAGASVKVAHHAKYDALVLRRAGLEVAAPLFDTMVAAWLIDPGRRGFGLKDLAWSRLGVEMTPITALIGSGRNQITMAEVPVSEAAPYAAADVDMTLRLAALLDPELDACGARELFETLEMPVSAVLTDMEEVGIRVDPSVLDGIRTELAARADALAERIHTAAGRPFNIASPAQLGQVLFAELGLPAARRTATGISTSADALADLAPLHPIVRDVLDWRHVAKLRGTYVDTLPLLIHPETGRVHTSWMQTSTVTGRLSSTDPNLQNIPVRSELGGQIRRAFVAEPGWQLLAADYSQMELRILAAVSGDEALRAVYREDGDVHAATAAFLFDKPTSAVTANERRIAKTVNFGTVYGISAFGLARQVALSRTESQAFIDRYFERYQGVRRYFDDQLQRAAEVGYVETLFGRRRYFPELRPSARVDHSARQRAEREAINAPIQGSAADITKRAMVTIHAALRDAGMRTRLLLQVHDELVLEAPKAEVSKAAELVRSLMERAAELDGVALVADVSTGPNWAELAPYARSKG